MDAKLNGFTENTIVKKYLRNDTCVVTDQCKYCSSINLVYFIVRIHFLPL